MAEIEPHLTLTFARSSLLTSACLLGYSQSGRDGERKGGKSKRARASEGRERERERELASERASEQASEIYI